MEKKSFIWKIWYNLKSEIYYITHYKKCQKWLEDFDEELEIAFKAVKQEKQEQ